jgi:hypothetical protein
MCHVVANLSLGEEVGEEEKRGEGFDVWKLLIR